MTNEEIIVKYVNTGRIDKRDLSHLKRNGGIQQLEKAASIGDLPRGTVRKLYRLLNLLQSQGSYKNKKGTGMYGAIKKSGEKSYNPYTTVSGGGVNSTGKKR